MNNGDYVRTKLGIVRIEKNKRIKFGTLRPLVDTLEKGTIIKSSPNIIDLIAVGDYVNGEKIIKIAKDHANKTMLVYGFDDGDYQVALAIYEKDIKSVLTREQYDNMKFEVKK